MTVIIVCIWVSVVESKQISHQLYSMTLLGVDFDVFSMSYHCYLRVGLIYRTHFSSSVTIDYTSSLLKVCYWQFKGHQFSKFQSVGFLWINSFVEFNLSDIIFTLTADSASIYYFYYCYINLIFNILSITSFPCEISFLTRYGFSPGDFLIRFCSSYFCHFLFR